MKQSSKTVVGLDVHKDLVVVGVLPPWSDRVTEVVRLENTPETIEKLVRRLSSRGPVEFVYEAGPCGYEIYRQVRRMGEACAVIAPGLIPVRATDCVKTDRRDAEKLARLWRAGELTVVHVPTEEEEAARDLVRVREDTLQDRMRRWHRLKKFLLRHGRVYREEESWSVAHKTWLQRQRFENPSLQSSLEAYRRALEEAQEHLSVLDQQVKDLSKQESYKTPVDYLCAFKGIDRLTAITILVEAQDLRRFEKAPSFMSFTGLTGRESTSADRIRRGSISKMGNAHIRRVLVESAWSYRRTNTTGRPLLRRRAVCPPDVVRLAKRAQDRLHRKFHRLVAKNKPQPKVAVSVARELAGFVWNMARYFPAPTA